MRKTTPTPAPAVHDILKEKQTEIALRSEEHTSELQSQR